MSRGILSFAMDSTGSFDAGVFDATEQNAGKPTFLRRRALHVCSRAFCINVNSRLSVKRAPMKAQTPNLRCQQHHPHKNRTRSIVDVSEGDASALLREDCGTVNYGCVRAFLVSYLCAS